MTTFDARLAGDRKHLKLWFTIQGIAPVFKESGRLNVSELLGEERPEHAIIVNGGVDEGEQRIDWDLMRVVGGSLSLRIKQRARSTVLDDLFQTRRRARTHLAATYSKTSTANISVGSSAWAADEGLIYMGAETIKYDAKPSGTTFGTITRGMYGSRPQRHLGASDPLGTAVFDVPQSWIGRRVKLYGSFVDDRGRSTAARTSLLGTFRIEEPGPEELGNGEWQIQCGPLIDEYVGKKLYVGLREIDAGVVYQSAAAVNATPDSVQVTDATKFVRGDGRSYVLIRFSSGYGLIGLLTDVDGNVVKFGYRPMFIPAGYGDVDYAFSDEDEAQLGPVASSAQHIALLVGGAQSGLLPALLSVLGDGQNGDYDLFPGREASAAATEAWRMGAGIHQDDVDVAAFLEASVKGWIYPLDATVDAGAVLSEWCLLSERLLITTPEGQLSCIPEYDVRSESVLTIDKSTIDVTVPPKVIPDEARIYPVLRVRANHNPATREEEYDEAHIDGELVQRYPSNEAHREIVLKGARIERDYPPSAPQRFSTENAMTPLELLGMGRRWQRANARPSLFVHVTCNLIAMRLRHGDVVTIGLRLSDREGGTLLGRQARVVGRRRRFDAGAVDLVLEVLDRTFVIAPSAVVAAISTTNEANDTITLQLESGGVGLGNSGDGQAPHLDFAVGLKVRYWKLVPPGTSQSLEIDSIDASNPAAPKIIFTESITNASQGDFITWDTLGENAGKESASGFDESDLLYFVDDDGNSADGSTRRWR